MAAAEMHRYAASAGTVTGAKFPMRKQRRSRIRLRAGERTELERRALSPTVPRQVAYRAKIVLRTAAGQTDASIAQDLGLAERTVWMWRRRFAERRLDGLDAHPKSPPPRKYDWRVATRLLALASCQPGDLDPTRAGETHWTIKALAEFLRQHPELGLGAPSKSTIGVTLKRHGVRLNNG